MTDTLLQSIRERSLDESEPLAGLLRKCLMLGAETGSDSLREWARHELNGYTEGVPVPQYRKIRNPAMTMTSISGNTYAQGQIVDRHQLPVKAREHLPEELPLTQPIEELEDLANRKQLNFATPGLAYTQTLWNGELDPFQGVLNLSYALSGAMIRGILGQIRTQLVDLIADLTSNTPLAELPNKKQVDAAMVQRIGQMYNTTIHESSASVAIGAGATANSEGLSVSDAVKLLQAVQQAAAGTSEADTQELVEALEDLQETVQGENPETGDVVKKVGKLRAAADKLGVAAITAATTTAATTFTELAVKGAFN